MISFFHRKKFLEKQKLLNTRATTQQPVSTSVCPRLSLPMVRTCSLEKKINKKQSKTASKHIIWHKNRCFCQWERFQSAIDKKSENRPLIDEFLSTMRSFLMIFSTDERANLARTNSRKAQKSISFFWRASCLWEKSFFSTKFFSWFVFPSVWSAKGHNQTSVFAKKR